MPLYMAMESPVARVVRHETEDRPAFCGNNDRITQWWGCVVDGLPLIRTSTRCHDPELVSVQMERMIPVVKIVNDHIDYRNVVDRRDELRYLVIGRS